MESLDCLSLRLIHHIDYSNALCILSSNCLLNVVFMKAVNCLILYLLNLLCSFLDQRSLQWPRLCQRSFKFHVINQSRVIMSTAIVPFTRKLVTLRQSMHHIHSFALFCNKSLYCKTCDNTDVCMQRFVEFKEYCAQCITVQHSLSDFHGLIRFS